MMIHPLNLVKVATSFVRVIKDPRRLDDVIAMADNLSNPEILQQIADQASRSPDSARGLIERPRVRIDLAALEKLPDGTFGRAVVDFFRTNGLDPDALPHRDAATTHDWIRAHLFETHDLWHVVTGFGTDAAGELGLQAYYMAQIGTRLAPLLLVGGLMNTILFAWDDRDPRMDAIARGWELGKRTRGLFGRDWGKLWSKPLVELRAELGFALA